MNATKIYEETTPKGDLVVSAYPHDGDVRLRVELDGGVVADAYPLDSAVIEAGRIRAGRTLGDASPKGLPAVGAVLTVGRVDFTGDRGRAILAALEGYRTTHAAAIEESGEISDDELLEIARDEAAAEKISRPYRMEDHGVTGTEADINATYEGGYAAFVRDGRPDRTPRHKGEIEGY